MPLYEGSAIGTYVLPRGTYLAGLNALPFDQPFESLQSVHAAGLEIRLQSHRPFTSIKRSGEKSNTLAGVV
jgi:hypothetical protein